MVRRASVRGTEPSASATTPAVTAGVAVSKASTSTSNKPNDVPDRNGTGLRPFAASARSGEPR
ncbi:hypothetical protein GTS_09290 [Gandjariella thermophila]|uniref:Uncharacterized protein n=1 Tax=Gandjariella thermophila TaxID=1931992 RepID=A0A4D4J455_9PSEU|nr:hypothetical protein GTS_09290 [Gandjariella thermophila]